MTLPPDTNETDNERDWGRGDLDGWEQLKAYDEEDPTAPREDDEDEDGYPMFDDYSEEATP